MTLVTSPQDSADSAGVLQLFLETYFTELLGEDAERTMDADQQQVPGPLILGGKQLFETLGGANLPNDKLNTWVGWVGALNR